MFDSSIFPSAIKKIPDSCKRYELRSFIFRMKYFWLAALVLFLTALAFLPWDRQISAGLQADLAGGRFELLSELVRALKVFGKGDVLVSLALATGVFGWRRRALEILLALVLVAVLVWPVKVGVGRERPRGGSFVSFPSGDAASAAAFAVPLLIRAPQALPLAGAVIASVAAGRVLERAHYTSDVLAGSAFGLVAGILAVFLCSRWGFLIGWRTFLFSALGFTGIRGACALAGRGNEFIDFVQIYGPTLVLFGAARFFRIGFKRNTPGGRRLEEGGKNAHTYNGIKPLENIFERMERDKKFERLSIILVSLLLLGIFIFSATRSTLWDRDEPRFSRASVEMVQSGDYLVPTFNGALRPDKPILIYWLMSITLHLLGQTELACRFFAPLGTLFACLLTYFGGRRLLGLSPPSALLAMVAVATTPLMIVSGTAATTDAVLLSLITASIFIFFRALDRGFKGMDIFLMALALGAAQLVKGPVGLFIPLLVIGSMLWLNRRDSASLRPFSGALIVASLVSIGIFLAWAIPANNATGGEFLRKGLGHHVLDRAVKPLESHGGSFFLSLPYYLPVIICGFFPWTLFLPGALSALFRGKLGSRANRALLLAWIVPTILLMSFVRTKLPHYILPAWPGLALAVAAAVDRAQRRELSASDETWLRRGLWLFVPVGSALALVLIVGPWFVPLGGVRGSCLSLGLLLAAMTVLGAREHRALRYRSAASILVLGMILFQIVLSGFLLPGLERFKVSPAIARAVTSHTAPGAPVVAFRYDEPSLIFYLDRKLELLGREDAVAAWAHEPGQGALILPRESWRSIEERYGALGLEEIGSAKGYNYTKGRWVDLVALKR